MCSCPHFGQSIVLLIVLISRCGCVLFCSLVIVVCACFSCALYNSFSVTSCRLASLRCSSSSCVSICYAFGYMVAVVRTPGLVRGL